MLDLQAALLQIQATQVHLQAMQEQMQATLVARSGQLLAAQARLEQLHRASSHNSLARVSNSHAQQGLSTLTPIQSEAEGHVSSHCQKPLNQYCPFMQGSARACVKSAHQSIVTETPLCADRANPRKFPRHCGGSFGAEHTGPQ